MGSTPDRHDALTWMSGAGSVEPRFCCSLVTCPSVRLHEEGAEDVLLALGVGGAAVRVSSGGHSLRVGTSACFVRMSDEVVPDGPVGLRKGRERMKDMQVLSGAAVRIAGDEDVVGVVLEHPGSDLVAQGDETRRVLPQQDVELTGDDDDVDRGLGRKPRDARRTHVLDRRGRGQRGSELGFRRCEGALPGRGPLVDSTIRGVPLMQPRLCRGTTARP